MAKAPKPKEGGYDAAKERQERAKQTFRVSVKESDVSFVYRPYGIPVRVRGHIADVTGKTVDLLLYGNRGVDITTFADMWWISRLCDGETGADGRPITRQVVHDEFDERCPGATFIYGSDKSDIVEEDVTSEVDDSPKA
jgi:hypothetical protein